MCLINIASEQFLVIKIQMGNIQIRQENPRQRRAPIFKQKRSVTPNKKPAYSQSYGDRDVYYSPIRISDQKIKISQSALTQLKPTSSRLNTSRFSNLKSYKPIDEKDQNNQESFNNTIIKKSQWINTHRTTNDQNVTSRLRKSDIFTGKIISNSRRFHLSQNYHQYQLNPTDNRDIIKKVRNFNDFLNQIKRKLKQDKINHFQRKKSSHLDLSKTISFKKSNQKDQFQQYTQNKNRQSRSIQVALKLQNQKLELQKYRKIVQRQLSKNHSIQNISLCTKKSGQKILTIQYQNSDNSPFNDQFQKQKQINFSKSSFQKTHIKQKKVFQHGLHKSSNEQHKSSNQQHKYPNEQHKWPNEQHKSSNEQKLLQKLRAQYQLTMKSMLQLGKTLQKYQLSVPNQQTVTFQNQSFYQNTGIFPQTNQKVTKIQKIQELFTKLSHIQNQYCQTDREVKQVLQVSESEVTIEDNSGLQTSYHS